MDGKFQLYPEKNQGIQSLLNLESYDHPDRALEKIQSLYLDSIGLIQTQFDRFAAGDLTAHHPAGGCYPYIQIDIPPERLSVDARYSYGIVDGPGLYGTTITRPDLFGAYLHEQLSLLIDRYKCPIWIGRSHCPIPLPFAVDIHSRPLSDDQAEQMKTRFVMPNLTRIHDHIVNNTFKPNLGDPHPLSLFSGERVDFSLHRLHHYTGSSPDHFQNFILLTNYQRYLDTFISYGHRALQKDSGYTEFVAPGDNVMGRSDGVSEPKTNGPSSPYAPQMPAFHLKRPDGNGISFVNIGIGPSNAKNITDHLAVLRPHAWIMLGHCAGLHRSQHMGDYVLAHGYVREDHVLDDDLPTSVPIPPIAEIQIALQKAIQKVTGLKKMTSKKHLRTGTVYTTDNRNWELRSDAIYERFKQSRAIALDMESATVAANGLRFRVPYGTLLCVSDKPIHGDIKLRGMANTFYHAQVGQHLEIGIEAVHILRDGILGLHSRKLRGFDEPAFR